MRSSSAVFLPCVSLLASLLLLVQSAHGCPAGWSESDGFCYGVINASHALTSAYDARELCRSYGADLPDVTSAQVQTLITDLLANQTSEILHVYIGQNDVTTEGSFTYTESTQTATFTDWEPGHPDTTNATGNSSVHCVALSNLASDWSTATWTNVGCCSELDITWAACQKPNTTNATDVESDLDVFAKTCFEEVNECDSQPCLNGATCNDHVLYFECACAPGYNGSLCESDACTPNPCQNGRLCSLAGVSYMCDCGDWYNGTNCENIVSLCHQELCQNNATCQGDTTSYQCTCLPGFTGDNCQTNIDDCLNATCGNGVCVDGINTHSCSCTPGYQGTTCDQQISCSSLVVANATSPNDTTLANYDFNSELFFSCLSGHKFPDMDVNKTTRCTGSSWTPAVPSCDLHCDAIPMVAHSTVVNGNTRVGTTVNFTCETGHQFADNSSLLSVYCVSPGNWSIPDPPDCQVVHCPALPVFPNQDLDTRNTSYNTLITFWCEVGYELYDHTTARTIKCLASGEWTADLPPCQPVTCPMIHLADVPGNTRNSSYHEYDSYVQYDCEQDKRMLDGSTFRVIRCDATGEWSDNITDCASDRCFPLPYVANATPNALDAVFGSVVTLTCIAGHRFFIGASRYESRTMTCQSSNQRWAPILAACEPIICPNLTIPMKASLSTKNRLFATVVNVTCDVGYYYDFNTMERIRYSRCEENGQWDVVNTDPCNPIPCPDAPDIFNGSRTGGATGHVYANQVTYDCDSGFKFVDGRLQKQITCTALGEWDDTDMSCRKDRCDPVPEVTYTVPSTRNTSWTTVVTYSCQPGYYWPDATEQRQKTCHLGTWQGPEIPPCHPKVCAVISKMANATVNGSDVEADRLYDTVIAYSCDVGFKFPDNETEKTRRCNEDGVWWKSDADFPVCQIIECPELEEVSNATRDSNSTTYDLTVNYVCDPGYQYPDKELSKGIWCTENGTWTAYPPPCEVVFCPPLPLWNEADFNSTSNELYAVVTYSCKDEFIFEDYKTNADKQKVGDPEKTSICSEDKTWDPPIFTCIEIKNIAEGLKGQVFESPSSLSIGTLAITLLALTGGMLLLLDANKLYTDLKFMRANISYVLEKRRNRISNSTSNIQVADSNESTA